LFVYVVTNLINGKRYIGLTETTLVRRWAQHVKSASMGSTTAIHRAIRKNGKAAFAITELACLPAGSSRRLLCEMERMFIAKEGTLAPNGYNMTPGGDGMPKGEDNPLNGIKRSAETRAKIKAGWTDERKAKAVATMNANRNRPDVQAKILASRTDPAVKQKIADSWTPERRAETAKKALHMCKVRVITPEAAKARNDRIIAAARTPEVRKLNSDRMKNRVISAEQRAAHSEKIKQYWAQKRSTLQ